MRTGALLGLVALAAFIYYSFVREGRRAPRGELVPDAPRQRAGDGSAVPPSPAFSAGTGTRFPEGDPTVRH
jgi:hypothetical protein